MSADEKDAIRARYARIDTSNVADVLDTLGYLDQGLAPEFAPYPGRRGKACRLGIHDSRPDDAVSVGGRHGEDGSLPGARRWGGERLEWRR